MAIWEKRQKQLKSRFKTWLQIAFENENYLSFRTRKIPKQTNIPTTTIIQSFFNYNEQLIRLVEMGKKNPDLPQAVRIQISKFLY